MYFSKIGCTAQALGSGLGQAQMGYGAHQLL